MKQMLVTRTLLAMCLMCTLGVLADDCASYVDANLQLHKSQTCYLSFCSGSCTNRYCSIIGSPLDQSQVLCLVNNLYMIIGVSVVFALILIGSIISCFFKSMFLCFRAANSTYMI